MSMRQIVAVVFTFQTCVGNFAFAQENPPEAGAGAEVAAPKPTEVPKDKANPDGATTIGGVKSLVWEHIQPWRRRHALPAFAKP